VLKKRRRPSWRAVVTQISVLLLSLGAVLVPAQPSLAASCSGSGCNGRDPNTAGCAAGAVTKKEHSNDRETIEIRYSPTCRAWWGRVRVVTADPTCEAYLTFLQFVNGVQSANARLVNIPDYFPHSTDCVGTQSWTYMIGDLADGDHYNACLDWSNGGRPTTPTEDDTCTGRL
jgi:hypothetical protein